MTSYRISVVLRVFTIAVAVLALGAALSYATYASEHVNAALAIIESEPAATPVMESSSPSEIAAPSGSIPAIVTRILPDLNATGWNPGYDRTYFLIPDPLLEWKKSTVIVNADNDKNLLYDSVCGISWLGLGNFIVRCSPAPVEGTSLYYTIISTDPVSLPLAPDLSVEKEKIASTGNQTEVQNQTHTANMTLT